jgi:uncharacterized protein
VLYAALKRRFSTVARSVGASPAGCEWRSRVLNGHDNKHLGARQRLKFRQLAGVYAVVRLAADAPVPDWATKGEFTSVTRTAVELSIVCPASNVPPEARSQEGWICLELLGPFPFSQPGVLLSFIEPLSSRLIPIFAISTYDTDYVLIQEEFVLEAIRVLRAAGHQLWPKDESEPSV